MDEKEVPNIQETRGFVVSHQKVDLSFDFPSRSIIGVTNITILPQRRDLKNLRFDAQQLDIPEFSAIKINGRDVEEFAFDDGFEKLDLLDGVKWGVHQHELQKERITPLLRTKPELGVLDVTIPSWIKIEDVNPFSENAPSAVKDRIINTGGMRASSVTANGGGNGASTPLTTPRTTEDANLRFAPLQVEIKFQCANSNWREGLQWVGLETGDKRYPHVYSRHSLHPGTASCIFPCVDDPAMRSTWEIVIKCGKTLGDALKPQKTEKLQHRRPGRHVAANTKSSSDGTQGSMESFLATEDQQLEMAVVCSADLTNEAPDPTDSTRKVTSFICANQVAARHIGFAIGPFETVDLSDMRDSSDDEKLGQKAVQVLGYCLPGRTDLVRNICGTLPSAVDWFSLSFGLYPFSDYKVCFVDDQLLDTQPLASLSLCSTRLLVPEDIIDPEIEFTHKLVHALASQWMGVNIIEASRSDTWAVVGISHFMTELFMKHLCGNNEYRFRQKRLSDKLVELDIQRPSLYALGETLHLGQFEMAFMELKAPLVMFILDRRLVKASGSSGLARIISKFFFAASTGEQLSDKVISTETFRKLCEKVGHYKVDAFFNQYVLGAGCPRFQVTQKFNKKRLAVEMTISQKQDTLPTQRKLEKDAFLREFKEETHGIYAGEVQVFTGPMTIRIHEADGTPYEHIVEIREAVQKIEIPYHTKYKRLKRSRREKEKQTAGVGVEMSGDNENDVLLYCLGDVLQSQDEMKEWGLVDWDEEVMQRMEQESYEWIRMDADFEWLAELTINMPSYMYVSQLQQDRDVVAQQDSMLYLGKSPAHPLVSTILVRTLMDRRYFHGIRTMAASYLPRHATEGLNWIGRRHLEKTFQHFFCHSESQSMPRSNDFSDKKAYLIQCAIPQAMSKIRTDAGKSPVEARRFILDQLSFNDNHNNEYSDHFYVANLMKCLTASLLPVQSMQPGELGFSFEAEDEDELRSFIVTACEEIDRYRRMDEWDPTYQNIYTTTALSCKQLLMAANVIPKDPMEFLRYAHDDCLDVVRIVALKSLVQLGFFNVDHFMQYFMLELSTDSSPFVRDQLFAALGVGLAGIAFGDHSRIEQPAPLADEGGLIVEEDANLELKKAQIARTMSIEGALFALRDELKDNEAIKHALWTSISSKRIGPWEQCDLLDICYVLFEAQESMIVMLKYPRYWKVEKVPKMRVRVFLLQLI